jgi:hypothetical protein
VIVQLLERIKFLEQQLAETALRACEMRNTLTSIAEGADYPSDTANQVLKQLYPEDYTIGKGITGDRSNEKLK